MTELRDSLVSNRPPLISILIILAVALMGFLVIGPMIGFMLAQPLYEGENLMTDMIAGSVKGDSSVPLLIVQGCVTFIGLIALPMLYIRFSELKSINNFFKGESNFPIKIGILFLILVTFVFAISPITIWNQELVFPEALKNLADPPAGSGCWSSPWPRAASASAPTPRRAATAPTAACRCAMATC